MQQRINFIFVEDRGGNRTIRQPDIIDGIIDHLDRIFENQANITFEGWNGGDIKLGSVAESMGETARDPTFQRLLPLRFPWTFYGRPARCQGFASPRKNRAPLTPPRPSNKSY
jgi:hypothetical protein